MDFEANEEQRLIADTARSFARERLLPRAAWRDQTETFPTEELQALGGLGLLGVNVPEALGGAAAGVVAYSLALSEIAAADASVSVAMSVTNMVAEVITHYGSAAQRERFVPGLCSGALVAGAFALSEPQCGSDAAALATTARRTASGYVLSGNKQWITSGDQAGVIVVWARTGTAKGARGISAFLVPKGTPGLSAGRAEDKMGLRGSSTVPLLLEECAVGEDALLGAEGDGFKIAMTALDGGRIGIASQAVGVAQAALRAARDYALLRQQFGRPIASFQAIQNLLADAATQLDAARLLTLRAAERKERGVAFSQEAAMAKLYASEMAGRVCDAAIQIHGGYGYTREFPVERYARDARVQRIYEGTSEVQRLVIARALINTLGSSHAS